MLLNTKLVRCISRRQALRLCLFDKFWNNFSYESQEVINYKVIKNKKIGHFTFRQSRKNFTTSTSLHQDVDNKKKKYSVDMSKFPQKYIRNFGIIAHIDHGKSTLSDRLLEHTGTISKNDQNKQVLDKLPVERERGITVKAQSASLFYEYEGNTYLLNLIDTPGVQAQTVANFNLAFLSDLTIIPVVNKIDLKNAKPDRVVEQIEKLFSIEPSEILKVSAKLGTGIGDVLRAVVERISPPPGDPQKPFRALLFDSWFDHFRGAIALVEVIDGSIKIGDYISSHFTSQSYEVRELSILHPEETLVTRLFTGQVGCLVAGMRSPEDAKVGDTLFLKDANVSHLPGFKPAKPMVYAGLYPLDQSQNPSLRSAIEKLCLNDSSVSVSIDSSPALGQGWRLGFLGLLHMEVFSQRLDQEFDTQVVITSPNVPYKAIIKGEKNIKLYGRKEVIITNPLKFPESTIVEEYLEPMVTGTIITPDSYLGCVISLCMERRGVQLSSVNIDNSTIMLQYKFPLGEIIVDFFDELKSLSSGYASFDYEESGYEPSSLVKMNILLNGQLVEELTTIAHSSRAQTVGRNMCQRLKDTIPAQLFQISIQAAVGGKILARENIKPLKKNVLAKCYGGDITRKMKLLRRQAEGKKKMRMIGNIHVPREAFIKVLKK
ncbi:translation factor Guf1, mitochondrial-like isoform X2 [Tachypleus tridentatus]|uniref:translation factor Guf1, mitochondrial-like isoform X2 n=1 Tax=Tachypleus tridentatus TaxID=6853 RepID=UPI003FD2E570